MPYTHDNRSLKLTSPLGKDLLLLQGFRGVESISSPFHLELDVISPLPELALGGLIRQLVTVSLVRADESWRYFNGQVSRISQGAYSSPGFSSYRLEVVPWLWFLNLSWDCRIFQNMSTREIVSQVFDDHGFHDYEFRGLSAGQTRRIYTVQYRESAFNFVSRLLEEEGIFYFFEHTPDKHLLVLADAPVQHPPCPGQDKVCVNNAPFALEAEDSVLELHWSEEIQPAKLSLADWNFEMPREPLRVELAADGPYEVYDYPGPYQTHAEGDTLARVRLEEYLAASRRVQGSGNCRAFIAGHRMVFKDMLTSSVETTQVLHTVTHDARQSLDMSPGAGSGEAFRYQNTFNCFPHDIPFRPPRTARKPLVNGTQTAIVTGPSGEEIYTDEYGRIKVQFHWDRRGKRDEHSSCWIRVAHTWAGRNWGAIFTPRVGQEVIVDFLEGDPDRPIVVGRVYNADLMPPYPLPAEKTKSTIKSESSKGGGGFNEIRFEDRKGEEEFYTHAQKDKVEMVLNNHTETVKVDHTYTIEGKQTGTIKKSRTVILEEENDTLQVKKGEQSVTIKGKTALTVEAGTRSVDVTGGSYVVTVNGGDISGTASGAVQLQGKGAGVDITGQTSGVSITGSGGPGVKIDGSGETGVHIEGKEYVYAHASTNVDLAGDAGISLTSPVVIIGDGEITIQGTKIELSTGAATLTLDASGITLSGPLIKIN